MKALKKYGKKLDYWLHFFGFKKREKSIKEKMCEAFIEKTREYKQEAREAVAELRNDYEKQVA